jgi:two-component system sensor histidine kinase YesM
VENAIYHGLKNKPDWGKITVTGHLSKADGKVVELAVIDDGVGMPAEELGKLNELLAINETFSTEEKVMAKEAVITNHDMTKGGSHFGLYSVAKRIKLYFGKEYGARIESEEAKGTTVYVTVPSKNDSENI